MIPESIKSLITSLLRKDLEVIVAGGLAVNAHGFARLTTDADLIVRKKDREKATNAMIDLAFTNKGSTDVSTRFGHKSYSVPFVDLLWTEEKTFDIFLSSTVSVADHFKILSLPHLIAMKIHALSQCHDRFAKDSEDIKFLLKHNSAQIEFRDYQALVNRFAPSDKNQQLLDLYPR